jgi:hypothetical protein
VSVSTHSHVPVSYPRGVVRLSNRQHLSRHSPLPTYRSPRRGHQRGAGRQSADRHRVATTTRVLRRIKVRECRGAMLAKEGVSGAPAWATLTACLQELFELVARSRASSAFQTMSRDVAHAGGCPLVPKCTHLVPAKYRNLAISGNIHAYLQGFCASPLTDSNRRPPPYHEREEGGRFMRYPV